MPNRRLTYLMMSLLMLGSAACGCRAPYPTYNPYGFYGQPCINPPGTGTYNPTGRTDPYYGAPTNGVYPPNPYAPAGQYPGYPPVQQPAANTSNRTWNPQTSTGVPMSPIVEPQKRSADSLIESNQDEWRAVENPNRVADVRTAMLDTQSTFAGEATNGSEVAPNNVARFDGFGRN